MPKGLVKAGKIPTKLKKPTSMLDIRRSLRSKKLKSIMKDVK